MSSRHPPIHTPERTSLTCPLGLRFYDVATGAFVVEGLQVEATPHPRSEPKIASVLTRSGIHAFHRLRGLPSFDPPDQPDPWTPPPPTREFRIQVADNLRRFLPCTFLVLAPHQGLYSLNLGSPPWALEGAIPLFSAPARTAPAGSATVRASLGQLGTGRPAAWALVEISYLSGAEARIARGLADEKGELVVFFPLPEGARRGFLASPPGSPRLAQWPLKLQFFWSASGAEEDRADYDLRLNQLAAAALTGTSPFSSIEDAVLTLGEETLLGPIELDPG